MGWKYFIKKINEFNDLVALKATLIIATMWCVYAFAVMVMIPFFIPSTTSIIQFISSAFLQLLFLPLIMVGQDVQGRKSEARAQQDHETIMAEMAELKAIHKDLHTVMASNGMICINCSNSIVQSDNLDISK